MTVIDVVKDTEALTLTLTAEFAAAPERVWQVWADPRQLEQWWGPPTWPATFVDHDFVVGGGRDLLHDRTGRRQGARLVAVREHRRASEHRVRGRLRHRLRRA